MANNENTIDQRVTTFINSLVDTGTDRFKRQTWKSGNATFVDVDGVLHSSGNARGEPEYPIAMMGVTIKTNMIAK